MWVRVREEACGAPVSLVYACPELVYYRDAPREVSPGYEGELYPYQANLTVEAKGSRTPQGTIRASQGRIEVRLP